MKRNILDLDKLLLTEMTDVPRVGDIIRTSKSGTEGKVTKLSENEVFFTTKDGRNLKSRIDNVIVIEKLMGEELNEISNELLARYKTAASKNASAANKKAWDPNTPDDEAKAAIARGNKRFSGIVRATHKQNANDARKRQTKEDRFEYDKKTGQMGFNKEDPDQRHGLFINGRLVKTYNTKEEADNVKNRDPKFASAVVKKIAEGSMGGINRSRPAQDVSYEKVLDRNPRTAHSKVVGEEQVNELDVKTMQNFNNKVSSPNRAKTASFHQLARDQEGKKRATRKIDTKTGNVKAQVPSRGTYESRLAEFLDLEEKREKFRPGQTKEKSYKGWNLRYQVRPKEGSQEYKGMAVHGKSRKMAPVEASGSSTDEVVRNLESLIDEQRGNNEITAKNVMIDFNIGLANDIIGHGDTVYAEIVNHNNKPALIISAEDQGGMKRADDRSTTASRRPGKIGQQAFSMNGQLAREYGLTHSRYTLGEPFEYANGIIGYPLNFHSEVYPDESIQMNAPGVTVAYPRNTPVAEVYQGPWQGDKEKLNKAPKTSLQGTDNIRFSDMVKDTIKTHGLKWAFDYYVNKNGLPPKQFQIFAGLTVKPTGDAKPQPTTVPSQPKATPKPQSWWQKLRGKLPFEE